MKPHLCSILACPMCKGDLKLTVLEEYEDEISVGSFHCKSCNETYKIDSTIPDFLPPFLKAKGDPVP